MRLNFVPVISKARRSKRRTSESRKPFLFPQKTFYLVFFAQVLFIESILRFLSIRQEIFLSLALLYLKNCMCLGSCIKATASRELWNHVLKVFVNARSVGESNVLPRVLPRCTLLTPVGNFFFPLGHLMK